MFLKVADLDPKVQKALLYKELARMKSVEHQKKVLEVEACDALQISRHMGLGCLKFQGQVGTVPKARCARGVVGAVARQRSN